MSFARWRVAPEEFDRWVDVLAENDNRPEDDSAAAWPDEIPEVSLLSLY
jgi:hypothetical protein